MDPWQTRFGVGHPLLCDHPAYLITVRSDGGRASVAYFYFGFKDENKKQRRSFLPSSLLQFTAHSIPGCDIISRAYSARGKGTEQPSDEVIVMLSATIQHPIDIIVDALDECPNTSDVRSPRERLLSIVNDLVENGDADAERGGGETASLKSQCTR